MAASHLQECGDPQYWSWAGGVETQGWEEEAVRAETSGCRGSTMLCLCIPETCCLRSLNASSAGSPSIVSVRTTIKKNARRDHTQIKFLAYTVPSTCGKQSAYSIWMDGWMDGVCMCVHIHAILKIRVLAILMVKSAEWSQRCCWKQKQKNTGESSISKSMTTKLNRAACDQPCSHNWTFNNSTQYGSRMGSEPRW